MCVYLYFVFVSLALGPVVFVAFQCLRFAAWLVVRCAAIPASAGPRFVAAEAATFPSASSVLWGLVVCVRVVSRLSSWNVCVIVRLFWSVILCKGGHTLLGSKMVVCENRIR